MDCVSPDDAAGEHASEAYARLRTAPNSMTQPWRVHAVGALVRLYERAGRPDEAAKYRALLPRPGR